MNLALLLDALVAAGALAAVAALRSCRGSRLRKERKRRRALEEGRRLPVASPPLTRSSYSQTFLEGEEGATTNAFAFPSPVLAKTKRSLGFTLLAALAASLALVAALAACYGLSCAEVKLLHEVEGLVDDVKSWFTSLSEEIASVGGPLRSASGSLAAAADALAAVAAATGVPAAATAASSLRDVSSAASDAASALDDARAKVSDVSGSISEIWEETLDPIASKAELGRLVVTLSLLAAATLVSLSLAASSALALPSPKDAPEQDSRDSGAFPLSSKRQRLRSSLYVSVALSLVLCLLLALLGTVYLAIALVGHDACANAEPQLLARARAAAGPEGNAAAATVAFFLYGPAPAARLSTILTGLPPSLSPASFDPIKEFFDLDVDATFADAIAAGDLALSEIEGLSGGAGGGAAVEAEIAAATAAAEAALASVAFAAANLTLLRDSGALSPAAVRSLYVRAKRTACCKAVDGAGSLWLSAFAASLALLTSSAAAGAVLEKAETRAQRRARALQTGRGGKKKEKRREGCGPGAAVAPSPSAVPVPSRPPPPVPALKRGDGGSAAGGGALLPFPSLEPQGSWKLGTRASSSSSGPSQSSHTSNSQQPQQRSISWGPATVLASAAPAPAPAPPSSSSPPPPSEPSAPPLPPAATPSNNEDLRPPSWVMYPAVQR